MGTCPWCIGAAVGFVVGVAAAIHSHDSFTSWKTWAEIGTSTALGAVSGGLSAVGEGTAVLAGQAALGASQSVATDLISGNTHHLARDALVGATIGVVTEATGEAISSGVDEQAATEAAAQAKGLQRAGIRMRNPEAVTKGIAKIDAKAIAAARKREAALAATGIGVAGATAGGGN